MKSNPSKVFALVLAALMLMAVLASCAFSIGMGGGHPGTAATEMRGSIDPKLVGSWSYQSTLFSPNGYTQTFYYGYTFSSSGHMVYTSLYYTIEGNFTTSDGKIYVTDVIYSDTEAENVPLEDKTIEYYIETGGNGFLRIGRAEKDINYIENSEISFMRDN